MKPMSAGRRWLIKKQLKAKPKPKENISGSPAAAANTVMFGLRVEPKERGQGFEFINEIKGGIIPQEFIPAVKKGVKEAVDKGVLAGYPLVDLSGNAL